MEVQKEVTAGPPLPPNWNEHLENTVASLVPYKLFPIASDTLEYATLAAMLSPLQIIAAEQVVNPNLWSRFVNTRKQILQSKSDDIEILSKLGLDEKEILQLVHISTNFEKDTQVAACPYNDNVALLFHCTRYEKNVDCILVQGLDERLGNPGKLGRGIYFADDPKKSMIYDGCGGTMLIFMVLLGDCLSVDHLQNKNLLVREPEKERVQQRNLSDIHFDSTVAYPVGSEYVIYNRYQCCPIYKIRYASNSTQVHPNGMYSPWRNWLPPFAWGPSTSTSIPMCTKSTDTDWPFHAKNIFNQMGVKQKEEIEMVPEIKISESEMKNLLQVLWKLGFSDVELCSEALKKNSFDLDKTVNYLLELGAMTDELTETEILNNNKCAILSHLGLTDATMNLESFNRRFLTSETDVPKAGSSTCLLGSSLDDEMTKIQNNVRVMSSLGFTEVEILDALRKNSCDLERSVNHLLAVKSDQKLTESEIMINNKLAVLSNLGFNNTALNLEILKNHSFDLDRSVNELLGQHGILEKPKDNDAPGTNMHSNGTERGGAFSVASTVSPQPEDCVICRNEYDVTAMNWKDLQCGHRICTVCYKQIEITRSTMAGVTHTFTKCPFCMATSGIEIGTCPNGTMTTWVVPTSCEGFDRYQTICIKYDINNGIYRLNRTAFLPDNAEGIEVLRLLRIAWDRRLCFTIGTSVTTGEENVLVWNIHQKTAQRGGVQSHGFPDDSYIERVLLELKGFGIEISD